MPRHHRCQDSHFKRISTDICNCSSVIRQIDLSVHIFRRSLTMSLTFFCHTYTTGMYAHTLGRTHRLCSAFKTVRYRDTVYIHQHISCDSELIWLNMSWCLWKKTTNFWSDAKRQMASEWTLHLSTSWMWTISVQLLLGLILVANAAWTKFIQLDVKRQKNVCFPVLKITGCPQRWVFVSYCVIHLQIQCAPCSTK